ncbi:hypothetical protein GJ744_000004 [Endocarpon pusillum]|uniref:Reverse transcriptase Ty1/copia-type domain-containing protein n=1 Tax=Endocarpon pusillum TaxID=364733 RepID=A0A8H7AVE4_9EURO|nr:hypothetical protein GJ744_000004 [Endocarpon pusillum]
MYGLTQRPKYPPLLTGKENWATWSKGFVTYLRGKDTYDLISDSSPIPINPSAIGELSNNNIKKYILDHEEIKEDKITPQKIAANKRKVTKALQKEYDEWQGSNYEIIAEIYFSCSVVIQSVIDKYTVAKELWTYLEKSYSSAGITTINSELLKQEDLSYTNIKNVQHLASTISKSKDKSKDTRTGQKNPQDRPNRKLFHCNNCGPNSRHPSTKCWHLHPELKPAHLRNKDKDQGKQQGKQQAKQQESTLVKSATTQFSNLQWDQLPDTIKKQFQELASTTIAAEDTQAISIITTEDTEVTPSTAYTSLGNLCGASDAANANDSNNIASASSDVIFEEGSLLRQLVSNSDEDISNIEYLTNNDENEHEFPGESVTSVYHQSLIEEPKGNRSASATALLSSINDSSKLSNPTYKQTLAAPDNEKWQKAIADENQATVANDTWKEVDHQPNLNVLSGKWVLKNNNNSRTKHIDDVQYHYMHNSKICNLKKTLHSPCQGPREWYEVIVHGLMTKLGFMRTHADHG